MTHTFTDPEKPTRKRRTLVQLTNAGAFVHTCPTCGHRYTTRRAMKQHTRRVHLPTITEVEEEDDWSPSAFVL